VKQPYIIGLEWMQEKNVIPLPLSCPI